MRISYAAASLLLAFIPVVAFSATDTQFYGQAHLSIDQLDNGNESGLNVSSNSSRVGVKITHRLDDRLSVIAQIEALVRIEEGDTNSDYFDARDTFVGLQGRFGMARVGYFDTPMKKVRSRTDFFGDKVGDARNIVSGGGVNLDKRFRNGVHYQTPAFNHLQAELHYSSNDSTGSTIENEDDAFSSAISYNANGLLIMLAYERQNQLPNAQGNAVAARSGIRMGSRYTLNDHWQLAAFVQQTDNFTGGDRTAWGAGASYKLQNYQITAQYYRANKANAAASDATMWALGIDRDYSKSLNFYAAIAFTNNADAASFNVSGAGHGKRLSIEPGADPAAFSVGTIFKF